MFLVWLKGEVMNIIVVGLNHKKTPIHIREKFSFTRTQKEKAYDILTHTNHINEFVIISTCNRSEIVAAVDDTEVGIDTLKDFYKSFFLIDGDIDSYFIDFISKEAVEHVFLLAAGLDSLVIGEDQILGQVKDAHEYAIEHKATKTILNKLFREAVTTSKKIKKETKISENPLSISSIAVKLIESNLGDLSNMKALIVGAGKMNKIVIENLIYKGMKTIYVTNRTKCNAMDLSDKYDAVKLISFKEKNKHIGDVDFIVSSTSAPHYVIHRDEFLENYNPNKKICMVDIALPRDIEPSIGDIEEVSLYDIDELKSVVSQKHQLRLEAANIAAGMIKEDCVKFEKWYNCLPIFPVIREIEAYSTAIVSRELTDFLSKLEHLEQKEKNQIQIFAKSLVKKLFKTPLHELKKAGENEQGELYAKITKEIFGFKNMI